MFFHTQLEENQCNYFNMCQLFFFLVIFKIQNHDQQKISNYFAKPASKLFTSVSNLHVPVIKTEDTKKTPEKTNQRLNENLVPSTQELLNSPDILPPTPPQPKRMKLDKNCTYLVNKEKVSKLQPKDLINQMEKAKDIHVDKKSVIETQICGAQTTKEQLKKHDENSIDCSEPAIESLKMLHKKNHTKIAKRDFYHLGRHKVIETDLAENHRELRLVVVAEDFISKTKRICMLRDMW